jgi:hypothetical protein
MIYISILNIVLLLLYIPPPFSSGLGTGNGGVDIYVLVIVSDTVDRF